MNIVNSITIITLSKAISTYLTWKSSYAFSAAISYKKPLYDFMYFLGEDSDLTSINPEDITAFINFMKSKETIYGKTYSLSTIAYAIDILRNFFTFWRGRGQTNINPAEIRRIRHYKRLKEVVTKEDFEKMIQVFDERYFEDLVKKLTLHLLWDTGMRVSELCELKINDIRDRSENGLRSAIIKTRKTMKYNLVVWGRETNRILELYLGLRLAKSGPHQFLLVTQKSKQQINKRTIQRWIRETLKEACIEKQLTPHSFRHGKAHHLIDQGAHHRDISAILRHANPMSTFHYLALNENRFMEVAGKYL